MQIVLNTDSSISHKGVWFICRITFEISMYISTDERTLLHSLSGSLSAQCLLLLCPPPAVIHAGMVFESSSYQTCLLERHHSVAFFIKQIEIITGFITIASPSVRHVALIGHYPTWRSQKERLCHIYYKYIDTVSTNLELSSLKFQNYRGNEVGPSLSKTNRKTKLCLHKIHLHLDLFMKLLMS